MTFVDEPRRGRLVSELTQQEGRLLLRPPLGRSERRGAAREDRVAEIGLRGQFDERLFARCVCHCAR